jgi:hypothetical protein
MSYLKEKSKFNIDAAQELINLNYYAPSVHCSYYASFQYMKFALKEHRHITYEKIESESLSYRGGSHNYLIDMVLMELNNNTGQRDYVDTKRKIKDLKNFRTDSDYHNIQIFVNQAEKCLDFSKEIIQIIKKNIA